MLAGHAGHARCAVVDDAAYLVPVPHVGWPVHDVERWLELVWYVLLPQLEQVRLAVLESALILCPLPQVGWLVHLLVWLLRVW